MSRQIKGVEIIVTKKFTLSPPKYDYMKFYRVIRYHTKKKYNLTTADLDMLFFLHGEGLFTFHTFKEFSQLCGWDEKRFKKLKRQGWVMVWRENVPFKHGAVYKISQKGANVVNYVYECMDSGSIPENTRMFKGRSPYNDRMYARFIRRMNAKNKEIRES